MQQIQEQLNEILKDTYKTEEERGEVISKMGELIMSEALVESIEAIKDESARQSFVEAINVGDSEKAISIAEANNVDVYQILENKSKEILAEVV